MASRLASRRRTREVSDDGTLVDSRPSATPVSSKRARRSPVLPDGYLSQPSGPGQHGGSGSLVHQPGSIVRVKLVNFVTYTAVEIFPGPSLNMVIGPNGTGKSTLVCAICLGLGWPPKHLGRQKEYSEFVKNGEREATIEVEICRKPGADTNPVITCLLKRDGSKAEFMIDGARATQKAVQGLARKFSIQIDNLCQFLPQDKVVEFAAMTPIDLLRSTQEAVASKQMLRWHDELKSLRAEQKDKERSQTSYAETLKNLEDRQNMQRADVERMREREQVKETIRRWTRLRPFGEFAEARETNKADKAAFKEADTSLKALQQELEPSMRAANDKSEYRDAIKRVVDDRKRVVELSEQNAQDFVQAVEELDAKLAQMEKTINIDKKNQKSQVMERSRHQHSIKETQRRIDEAPPEFDAAFHNERISTRTRRQNELSGDQHEAAQAYARLKRDLEQRADQGATARHELKNLDTQAGQQSNKLSRLSKDTYRLWNWIKEHQGNFEKPVFGPPMVECSIKDPRYVALIESLFQQNNLIAITAQTKKDFDTIQDAVHGELKLHQVALREVSTGLERYNPPVSHDSLPQYGLEGYALDYITGPEPVLAMLCDDLKLHQTGVSLQDSSSDHYRMLEASNISSWVTKSSIYRVTRRREYGPGAISTSVRDTRPAQCWTDQPVDPQAKLELEQQISETEHASKEISQQMVACKERGQAAQSEAQRLKTEIEQFNQEKHHAQKALSEYRALPTKLEQFERKLHDVEELMQEARTRINNKTKEWETRLMDKGQAALDHALSIETLHQAHESLFEAELMHIEASSDHEVLAERNRTVEQQLQERRMQFQDIERRFKESRKRAVKTYELCRQAFETAAADPPLHAFLTEKSKECTTQQIEDEISAEQARLELMHEGSGRIIEEFEERERKIAEVGQKLRTAETSIAEKQAQIQGIRSRWEPKLDNLIKRISDSFAFNMKQINCAGEVGVEKDDDFDRWAVRIAVKFREEEALTQLDSHRQSGGERAVSTIFYLMSLQSLARSPFRVVDEINQGMDPRNERLVHSRMVAIATGNDEWLRHYQSNLVNNNTAVDDGLADSEDELDTDEDAAVTPYKAAGSQYFLITPKLLHGLRYEPGMRVLCIASGEFMPESQSQVNFSRSLEIRKNMAALAAG